MLIYYNAKTRDRSDNIKYNSGVLEIDVNPETHSQKEQLLEEQNPEVKYETILDLQVEKL